MKFSEILDYLDSFADSDKTFMYSKNRFAYKKALTDIVIVKNHTVLEVEQAAKLCKELMQTDLHMDFDEKKAYSKALNDVYLLEVGCTTDDIITFIRYKETEDNK